VVYLAPGIHPALLRFAGFEGATVPALDLGERKVQGSRSISRALETVKPEPRLFPADPEQRYAVEEAERWGEDELQETVRRIFRWAAAYQQPVRRWLAELAGVPAPGLIGALNAPLARCFARRSGADERRVRDAIAQLSSMLDHADGLIASGVVGSPHPNAADFQIGSSVRVVTAFPGLRPMVRAQTRGRAGAATLSSLSGAHPRHAAARLTAHFRVVGGSSRLKANAPSHPVPPRAAMKRKRRSFGGA